MTGMRIAHLYPEHLNIYADRGNIAAVARRCEWRGIRFELMPVDVGDPLPAADAEERLADRDVGSGRRCGGRSCSRECPGSSYAGGMIAAVEPVYLGVQITIFL